MGRELDGEPRCTLQLGLIGRDELGAEQRPISGEQGVQHLSQREKVGARSGFCSRRRRPARRCPPLQARAKRRCAE